MTRPKSEREFLERFSQRYQKAMAPVSLDIEEQTLGTRLGAASWSLPSQVEQMAAATMLGRGDLFLDIGSGAGWPGLRISELTGGLVTLSDVTFDGLRVATDGPNQISAVQSDGCQLPFADASFAAVTHSDVLCCLPKKLETLRECRRVVTDDGVVVFTVIATGPNMTDDRWADFRQMENEFVYSDAPYTDMVAAAGFDAEFSDVTAEFGDLADRLHKVRTSRFNDLVDLWGIDDAQNMVDRAAFNRVAAVRGELIRHFVVAKPVSHVTTEMVGAPVV